MFKAIDNFFYRLTRDNWGFPWHIIISQNLLRILMIWIPLNLAFTAVFFIGIAYELYQLWKAKKTGDPFAMRKQKKDSGLDLAANLIGLFAGLFL